MMTIRYLAELFGTSTLNVVFFFAVPFFMALLALLWAQNRKS